MPLSDCNFEYSVFGSMQISLVESYAAGYL